MDQISVSTQNSLTEKSQPGGRALTTAERKALDLSQKIKGWGSDLDPKVRPGVPMDKAPLLGIESLYPDIEPQPTKFKVHKSTEHGKMTPVFGNVCPPKGLSGLIRDHAFTFSEGQTRHWLYLVLADRVDMVEVLLSDVARLDIPNIPKEMGVRALLKYNKKTLVKWSAIAVGLVAVGALVANRRNTSRKGAKADLNRLN